jgi:hypothetical protein
VPPAAILRLASAKKHISHFFLSAIVYHLFTHSSQSPWLYSIVNKSTRIRRMNRNRLRRKKSSFRNVPLVSQSHGLSTSG